MLRYQILWTSALSRPLVDRERRPDKRKKASAHSCHISVDISIPENETRASVNEAKTVGLSLLDGNGVGDSPEKNASPMNSCGADMDRVRSQAAAVME